ncbi:MAG: MMPL family transporter, partial [Spirochaetes bacterium]|nr:MMPL family transporter [Spirochaetota bacterium]
KIITNENLKIIDDITYQCEHAPYIDEVTSITNADFIEGIDGGLEVGPLAEYLPESEEELKEFKNKLISWDIYKNNLYSEDFQSTCVLAKLITSNFNLGQGNGEQKKYFGSFMEVPEDLTTLEFSYTIGGESFTIQPDNQGRLKSEHLRGKINKNTNEFKLIFRTAPDKETTIESSIPRKIKTHEHEVAYHAIMQVLDQYKNNDLEFYVSGLPAVTVVVGDYMIKDMIVLIPFVVALVLLILFFSFKRLGGVILPTLTVVVSTTWAIGTMVILGKNITIVSTCIPVILIAVGSAYGIHIITHYYEEIVDKGTGKISEQEHRQIVFHVLSTVGKPVFLAALTTSVGFLALITSPIIPLKDFGIFTALGVFTALFVAVVLIPSILLLRHKALKSSGEKMTGETSFMTKMMLGVYHFLAKRQYRILVLSVFLIGLSIYGITKIKIDSQIIKYFKPDSTIRIADVFLNEYFAGTNILEVKIKGENDGDLAHPKILKQMDNLADYLESKYSEIGKVIGFHDMIKRMNQVMHNPEGFEDEAVVLTEKEFVKILNRSLAHAEALNLTADEFVQLINKEFNYQGAQYNEIPYHPQKYDLADQDELKSLIAQYLLLYSGSLDSYAGTDIMEPDRARMTILMHSSNAELTTNIINDIKKFEKEHFPAGYSAEITGGAELQLALNNLVVSSQVYSLLLSLLVVFIIITLSFKSFVAGFIGVTPLSISILLNFGFMGIFGIELNIATAMIASIAIGVGVDYTIHFLSAYHHQRKKTADLEVVTKNTMITSGKAIIFNATSVGLGFAVLIFSNFSPLIDTGILTAIIMATSSIGAMTLLPTLLNIFKPKFLTK